MSNQTTPEVRVDLPPDASARAAACVSVTQQVSHVKELEEDAWYREWVDRNTIRHERAKAAGAY